MAGSTVARDMSGRRTSPRALFRECAYARVVAVDTTPENVFDQHGFAARFEWGEAGLRSVASAADVVVLVDVLSFSTAVDVAVSRSASVYPYRVRDATAAAFARELGAVLAADRRHVSPERPFSLSPPSLATIRAGTRVVLPSPNGSALTLLAVERGRVVLAGCLRNARAVALAAQRLGNTVTVIAAGEQRADGTLRFAMEDLLGAGAILSHFPMDARSPEAEVAVGAFERVAKAVLAYLHACASGRELGAIGFTDDVRIAAELDVSETVPIFHDGAYTAPSN